MKLGLDPIDVQEQYRHQTPRGSCSMLGHTELMFHHFVPQARAALQAAGRATYSPHDKRFYTAIHPPSETLIQDLVNLDAEAVEHMVKGLVNVDIDKVTEVLAFPLDITEFDPETTAYLEQMVRTTKLLSTRRDFYNRVEALADERGVKWRHDDILYLLNDYPTDQANQRAWVKCLQDTRS